MMDDSGLSEAYRDACRFVELENDLIHALQESATYRLLLLTALTQWRQERAEYERVKKALELLMGVTPMHPENDDHAD